MCQTGSERIRRSRGGRHKGRVSSGDRVPVIENMSRNVEKKKQPARKMADGMLTSRHAFKSLFPKNKCRGNWEMGTQGMIYLQRPGRVGRHRGQPLLSEREGQSRKPREARTEEVSRIDLGVTVQRGLAIPLRGAALL